MSVLYLCYIPWCVINCAICNNVWKHIYVIRSFLTKYLRRQFTYAFLSECVKLVLCRPHNEIELFCSCLPLNVKRTHKSEKFIWLYASLALLKLLLWNYDDNNLAWLFIFSIVPTHANQKLSACYLGRCLFYKMETMNTPVASFFI